MWDTVQHVRGTATLSHDLPCPACGHAAHSFLACSDECACVPPPMPGSTPSRSVDDEVTRTVWLSLR